ncbi:MAG: hypothetical protein EOO34_00045 [Cyanobacteriota bacterium]|nr:MAG: hypothetical protein EOO34_00045 [Cyanobacteriota bacterium]
MSRTSLFLRIKTKGTGLLKFVKLKSHYRQLTKVYLFLPKKTFFKKNYLLVCEMLEAKNLCVTSHRQTDKNKVSVNFLEMFLPI